MKQEVQLFQAQVLFEIQKLPSIFSFVHHNKTMQRINLAIDNNYVNIDSQKIKDYAGTTKNLSNGINFIKDFLAPKFCKSSQKFNKKNRKTTT